MSATLTPQPTSTATLILTPTITPTITVTPPPITPTLTITDLVPPGLPIIPAIVNPIDQSETAVVLPSGAAVLFMNGRVLAIAEAGVFTESVSLILEPEPVISSTAPLSTPGQTTADPADWPIRFSLEAHSVVDNQLLETFGQPARLAFDLRGLVPVSEGQDWIIAYQDAGDADLWHHMIVSLHDAEGLISTATTHFSQWGAVSGPSPWRYRWNPPTVSTFSGAATYRYPIEVPAGRNGLTPNIDISYSSRGVDSILGLDIEQGPLGLGWSLNNIEITRDGIHTYCCWNDSEGNNTLVVLVFPDSFSLVLNGESYPLVPDANADTSDEGHVDRPQTVRYYARNAPSSSFNASLTPTLWALTRTSGTGWSKRRTALSIASATSPKPKPVMAATPCSSRAMAAQ